MAFSALGALQPDAKRAWVKESIRAYRENSFFEKFMGTDENSIVQRVTELKRTEKGDRAMIGLVQDLATSGVVGDNELIGRTQKLDASWVEIPIDQLRNGTESVGRMDDQKSVFDFRTESRDKLAFWRAKILDELMILTASGISYAYNTDGSARVPVSGQDDLTTLSYAGSVTAPSTNRHFDYDGSALVAGNTATVASTYVPKYGMCVDAMAQAATSGIKPLRIEGGEYRVLLVHPKTFAALKKDADFRDAVIRTYPRDEKHPILTGATLMMDGLIIHTSNRVFTTLGAASGSKWGAAGAVNGTRSLLLGAQALGFADIWGSAQWDEERRDVNNRNVIAIGIMGGVIKPVFKSVFDSGSSEDFGVMAIDHYIA